MTSFHDMTAATPTAEAVAAEYAELHAALATARSSEQKWPVFDRWDALRRRLETWEALVQLRFQQDTRDEHAKAAREYCDQIRPKLTELLVGMKREWLKPDNRVDLERRFGSNLPALFAADVLTYEPVIEQNMVREAQLEAEYVELLAAATVDFQGQTYNLSEIVKFREHADRAVRHAAERARWSWFDANRESLDRIYDDLVRLRDGMARKLGFDNFVGLGYQRMKRVDYNQADVQRFRDAVRDQLVPLCQELRREQAAKLGLDRVRYWDEAVHDAKGNPAPLGDHDWMIARAREMFDELSPELGQFFGMMVDNSLTDLKNRPGKAGGGFCTSFPAYGVPFIFANFNGTKGDVEVFTHEMGHAAQAYLSRNQPVIDYLWPTYESCEIHSMSLEFLTWPHMERFFGDDAERFRRTHLTQSLLFIPYGVAVDHFQHLVYERPAATPAERHAMWQQVERTYLPWRDYGDLPHVGSGGMWQMQRHIYLSPFYYIDYTLAQTCALQFWVRARRDFGQAMSDYLALCRRGGEAPFQALARSAGLVSPFEPNCLRDVLAEVRG